VSGVETEMRWPVWTLSRGGASIVVGGTLRMTPGLRRKVSFVQRDLELGTAEAEIVYMNGNWIGLCFLKIDPKLRESLEHLFAASTLMP
jgi:PilZ domain-containing protein